MQCLRSADFVSRRRFGSRNFLDYHKNRYHFNSIEDQDFEKTYRSRESGSCMFLLYCISISAILSGSASGSEYDQRAIQLSALSRQWHQRIHGFFIYTSMIKYRIQEQFSIGEMLNFRTFFDTLTDGWQNLYLQGNPHCQMGKGGQQDTVFCILD